MIYVLDWKKLKIKNKSEEYAFVKTNFCRLCSYMNTSWHLFDYALLLENPYVKDRKNKKFLEHLKNKSKHAKSNLDIILSEMNWQCHGRCDEQEGQHPLKVQHVVGRTSWAVRGDNGQVDKKKTSYDLWDCFNMGTYEFGNTHHFGFAA